MALATLHCCKFHSFPSDIQVTPFQRPDDIHLLLLIFLVDFMNCVAPLQSWWSRPIKSKPQWTFYSAPSIFAVFRNLVREIWVDKSGSRNLVREIWFEKSASANSDFFQFEKSGWPEKREGLYYKSIFFQVGEKWFYKLGFFFSGSRKVVEQKKKSKFAEPLSTLF